jgi:hypothetical protein
MRQKFRGSIENIDAWSIKEDMMSLRKRKIDKTILSIATKMIGGIY